MYKFKNFKAMKRNNPLSPNDTSSNLLQHFATCSLNHSQMFEIRGGKEDDDDEKTKGSTADRQDDGFN